MMVAVAPVRDEFHLSRAKASVIAVGVVTLLAIPSALSFTSAGLNIGDRPFLDVMDQVTGSGVVIVAGIVGAALIAWRIPMEQLLGAMNSGVQHRWVIYIGRYLAVAVVALMLAVWMF